MRRAEHELLAALRGCMADVLGPVDQLPGARADACVVVGERHLVLVAVVPPSGAAAAARRLSAFDATRPLRGPVGPVQKAGRPRLLRVVAVTGRLPSGRPLGPAPVVAARALARYLQEAADPDDVWLELASADAHPDGWAPGGPACDPPRSLHRAPSRRPLGLSVVLRAARLPRSSLWQSVEDDGDGMFRLASTDGPTLTFASVRSKAALVMPLSAVPPDDRPFAQALGQAVASDLARAVRAAGSWRRRPTVLALIWDRNGDRLPRSQAVGDGRGIDVRAGRVQGAAAVAVTGDLAGGLAAGPAAVRAALADAAAQAMRLQGIRAQRFAEAWQGSAFGLVVAQEETAPALKGHDEPIDGLWPEFLIERLLAAAGSRAGVMGRHDDEQARDLLNHRVVPAALVELGALSDGLEPDVALTGALARLQSVLGTHMRMTADQARALRGPWRRERAVRDAQRLGRSLYAARAAELAVEAALARDGAAGGDRPDRIDARLVEAAAAAALRLALASQQSHAGLTRLIVEADLGGRLTVTERPGGIPASQYAGLRRLIEASAAADVARSEPKPSRAGSGLADVDEPFASLTEGPEGFVLRPLDDGVRAATGAGIDAFVAVLATAADLDQGTCGIARADAARLARGAADWARLPESEAVAAVSALTLSRDLIRGGDFDFWRLEARKYRLATRPLVEAGDRALLVAPARARATQLLFARYLSDARLPWSPAETAAPQWQAARNAASALRQQANRGLERLLADGLRQAGLAVRTGIKPSVRKGLPFLPGEIDVLAADSVRRRLWLVEAKDAHLSFSAVELSDEIGDIHGDRWPHAGRASTRDEAGRLAAKADACRRNLTAALAHVGADGSAPGAWTVHAVIVTPTLSPAAFVEDPVVLFAVAHQLVDVVAAPAVPVAGPVLLDPVGN